ncbi:MAG: hypothetical protein JJE39_03825 [Vicinamibacteria bacterium]|nr:hypothetical protein [Vicinamibacteria bacterium]
MSNLQSFAKTRFAFLASTLCLGLGLAVPARSGEKAITLKDAPTAVQKTIGDQMKGGALRGLSVETEKGKTVYEAELTVDGRSKDLLIDGAGMVLEIEAEMELSALPEAVRAGLQREAGKGSVTKVEQVTRGAAVSYEALVKEAGKKNREVVVGADGGPIASKK